MRHQIRLPENMREKKSIKPPKFLLNVRDNDSKARVLHIPPKSSIAHLALLGFAFAPPTTFSMEILAWNCRGLNNDSAMQALLTLIWQKKPSFIFLSETKIHDVEQMDRL